MIRRKRSVSVTNKEKLQTTVPTFKQSVRLWQAQYPPDGRTPDQRDADTVYRWLQDMDLKDRLTSYLNPNLAQGEKDAAQIEGWILGVT